MQLYLDDGAGPGLVRVGVVQDPPVVPRAPRGETVRVTITYEPDDCLRSTAVAAEWPDGTVVEVDIATCLSAKVPAPPALTAEEAVRVATDPRWGVLMDRKLVAAAAEQFPKVPVLRR